MRFAAALRGFRQRRATPATRGLGFAAYLFALAAVLWKQIHFWSSSPRWDLLGLIALAALCGVGWTVASALAPVVAPAPAAGPVVVDPTVGTDGPGIPRGIPGPGRGLARTRGAFVGLLVGLADTFALATALGPNGAAGRQSGDIHRVGGAMPVVFVADGGRVLWGVVELDSVPSDRQGPSEQPAVPVDAGAKPASIPRYGRFHPVLHFPAAVVLGVGGLAESVRLVTYSDAVTTWLLFPVAVVAPLLACSLAAPRMASVGRMRRLAAAVPVRVNNKMPG